MSTRDKYNIKVAQECIQKSLGLIDQSRKHIGDVKESNIRHNFTSYLRLIFPDVPWWVEDHISRGEANTAFSIAGKDRIGFVDNLVGSTAIEYETDLEQTAKFKEGLRQVHNYCAALVNKGHAPDLIIGVLSDSIRWRAYRIKSIATAAGNLGGEHLELDEVEQIDLTSADATAAIRLVTFLLKYLGRQGMRPLSAETIARDLGFDSSFCATHTRGLQALVDRAFQENPKYAELIVKLWCSFVTYLRDRGSSNSFDRGSYADELYILTLAKLICANILERKALLSDDRQMESILDGRFFQSKGLTNLVEYDYFGWLNHAPFIQDLMPIAHALQADLEAYDFGSPVSEDIFGRMMAQLARRTQRLLLGQEWTPPWLAALVVENVLSKLSPGTFPQLVDMCCGSGAMIVEVVKRVKTVLANSAETLSTERRLQQLSQAITGFDIDPLSVMLSKINWVLTTRDWLEELNGAINISIPIYHADSLFAITPLSTTVDEDSEQEFYTLKIAEYSLNLPHFLVAPKYQVLFDSLLGRCYEMVVAVGQDGKTAITVGAAVKAMMAALRESGCDTTAEQRRTLVKFIPELVNAMAALNRDGRNGIWAFILRNSYRPGLVAGQFNGVVSNPPWLALSKIADNPYKNTLRHKSELYGIKPEGPSHLHIELATIFLLHAVDRYLEHGATVGCIAPDTVLNGHHHNPFRSNAYATAKHPIEFEVDELWRVQTGTFKNEACVIFGHKVATKRANTTRIPGALAKESGVSPLEFERVERGSRVVWTDNPTVAKNKAGFFEPAPFHQGADIMPRTLVFHEIVELPRADGRSKWSVNPIDKAISTLGFAVKDAKKHKDFKITPRTIQGQFVFDVLTSNLLTPFDIEGPLKALLPIHRGATGKWEPIDAVDLATDPSSNAAFEEILAEFGNGKTLLDLFAALDSDRCKLTQQQIPENGFLVFTGAGGSLVCCAYASVEALNYSRLIVDQTLYWAPVKSENEAIYLTGLLNSDAVNRVIQEFQPRGAFGERHVHTLAHEATPPYDINQEAHQDVVRRTRDLLREYQVVKHDDADMTRLLDPNSSRLDVRRRQIRAKIAQLPAFEAYELACRNLYGV